MRRRNWIFAALAAAGVMLALAAAPADAQEKNFEETLHAAEQGDAEAQFNLGVMYDNGADHIEESVKWWRAAAEQGHAKAQYNLGAVGSE
ncbi:MAG: hypothetical protein ACYYKD_13225 [Rhodospirillales bacterium]